MVAALALLKRPHAVGQAVGGIVARRRAGVGSQTIKSILISHFRTTRVGAGVRWSLAMSCRVPGNGASGIRHTIVQVLEFRRRLQIGSGTSSTGSLCLEFLGAHGSEEGIRSERRNMASICVGCGSARSSPAGLFLLAHNRRVFASRSTGSGSLGFAAFGFLDGGPTIFTTDVGHS